MTDFDFEDVPEGCPECGAVLPVIGALKEALRDVERELRTKRATIRKLRGELEDKRRNNPFGEYAWECFREWVREVAPDAREFTGPRFDNVVARIKARDTPEEGVALVKKAIQGAKRKPYVLDGGIRSATGRKDQRNVDLELICRTEGHLMRFASYAEPEASADVVTPDARRAGAEAGASRRAVVSHDQLTAWQTALTDDVARRLRELRGWSPEAVRRLGLGLDRDRVVFPIRNQDNVLSGLVRYQPNTIRRRGGPKSLAEGERNLFPAPERFAPGGDVWLVEGEPDVVAAFTIGLRAIGVPGVAKWNAGWAHRFERFERVIVMFDCDQQGRTAAQQRARSLETVTSTMVVDLDPARDDGYDLGALVFERGAEAAGMLEAMTRQTSLVIPMPTRTVDPIERVVEELDRCDCRPKRADANQWNAKCPNHDDRHPSLSVSTGRDGRVLLHCHAGCSAEQVLEALRLGWKDVFPGEEAV